MQQKTKKLNIFLAMLFAMELSIVGSALAIPTTITFSEPGAPPSGTQLDTNSFYDSFGVSFENSLLISALGLLPDDDFGIQNSPGTVGAADFFLLQNVVDFTWARLTDSVGFFARALDTNNNIVDSFSIAGGAGPTSGTASLSGSIMRFEFESGSAGEVVIDTLTFDPVPEPSTMLLLGLGLVGLGFYSRHRMSKS